MRQRAIRHPRRVQVRFWPETHPEQAHAGYSRNVSATGMFIATVHPLKPGTLVSIEFREDSEAFRVQAKVVHSAKVSPLLQAVRPSGMGVRFLDRAPGLERLLPEDERAVLNEFHSKIFPIYFASGEELLRIFDRDIKNGGLFVPTERPAEKEQLVSIELHLPRSEDPVLTFDATVVHRVDAGPDSGIGIAFRDPPQVLERLGPLVDSFR